jgi:PadR family transcriptional regulator PadR
VEPTSKRSGGVHLRIDKELLKGSTPILVLSMLNSGDKYGYQLIQELKAKSDNAFELKEGSLYPILHGLENDGAVSSYWEDSSEGRSRKYYRITKSGKKMLEEKTSQWSYYTQSMAKVIGEMKGGATIGFSH